MFDGREDKSWRTQYNFIISAAFTLHPTEATFTMAPQSFYIRDYCAAMVLDGPAEAIKLDSNFNMTMLDEPTFDSVLGNWTEPWIFNVTK